MIIANHAKAVNAKLFFHNRKVIIKKLFENSEVIFCKLVHATIASTLFFASNAKGIFTAYQNVSKVVVPKIGIKAANSSNIKQLMDLLINASDELFLLIISSIKFFADIRHREQ